VAGWTHLPVAWLDVWSGAYHDSVSGAYLYYRIEKPDAKRSSVMRQPADVVTRGLLGEYPYEIRTGENARARYEALWAEALQGPPELAESMRRLLPAQGATYFAVTATVGPEEWTFESAPTKPDQEARIRQLFLSRARLATKPEPCDASRKVQHSIPVAAYEAVPLGATVNAAIAALGPAFQAIRVGAGGFLLEYRLERDGHEVGFAGLVFDREQKLTAKKRN
jgi:hypothetical protein